MSIAPHVLQQITQRTAALVAERVTNSKEGDGELDAEVNAVIARIPGVVAEVSLEGGSYAGVMTIIEGRDFFCSGWKARVFSKAPQPEWLNSAAAAVYAWCEEAGLRPFLAPYIGFGRRESRILVQWTPARCPGSGADIKASFLENICEVTAKANARKSAEHHRERVKKVRRTIGEMHRMIDRYSREFGSTEVEVTRAYSARPDPELRDNGWTGDIITYCESLGLTVRIETRPDHSYPWPDPLWCSVIYASWERGMKVRKPD